MESRVWVLVNTLFHGWGVIDDVLRIRCQITWKALKVIQGANYGSVEGRGWAVSEAGAEVKRTIWAIHSYSLLLGHLCLFQTSLAGYIQPSTFCTNLKSKQDPSMQSKVILFHLFQQKWVFNQRCKLSNKINSYFERVCYRFLIIKGSNYSWCLDHRLNQAL